MEAAGSKTSLMPVMEQLQEALPLATIPLRTVKPSQVALLERSNRVLIEPSSPTSLSPILPVWHMSRPKEVAAWSRFFLSNRFITMKKVKFE